MSLRAFVIRALLLAALGGCATPSSSGGEKGGLRAATVKGEALDAAFEPRRFALVIGIGEFDDERWRDLQYAQKDARDVAAALKDPARGRFDRVVALTSPAETTREQVLGALDALAREASRPDDIVVVYLSAHGTLARDRAGELRRFLVTRDARYEDIPGSALAIDTLQLKLGQFGSRRRLLVLATCHSGSGKSLLPDAVAQELEGIKSGFYARPLEEVSRAAIVLAASDWGETAREDPALQNDIYTHFLLEGLDGTADRNADGAVSATEAHDHARRKTFKFTGGRQRPSAEILEVGADPIILAGRVAHTGRPELYTYNPRFDGFVLKVDDEERTELPGGAALRPGIRKVELTKGDTVLFSKSVAIGDGERLELEALIQRASPRRTVYLMGGAVGFLDARSREEILPAAPQLGLSLRWDDVPLRNFSLWFDASGSTGDHTLSLGTTEAPNDVPFRHQSVSLGAAAAWRWTNGQVRFLAGPRLAGLWIQRSFDVRSSPLSPPARARATQHYFTLSPGAMVGLSVAATDWLELSAQGSLMMTYVTLDGRGQVIGFTGGWAGAGYRF